MYYTYLYTEYTCLRFNKYIFACSSEDEIMELAKTKQQLQQLCRLFDCDIIILYQIASFAYVDHVLRDSKSHRYNNMR